MINTLLYRVLLAVPTMLGVAIICFMLVQIAPGGPAGVGDAAGRLGGAAPDADAGLRF
ncbi:microcin C ABC transporter permease YejB [Raoultella terrigena]|nr:microcin C ABC transporter permease YejB [Raoultella terrigena]